MAVEARLRRLRWALLASVTLCASAAGAQVAEPRGAPEPPDLVELTGHVGKPAAGETGGWNISLGAGFSPIVYDFHLSGMRILNSGRLPLSVLSQLEPYRPTFFVFGGVDELAVLATATPSQTLVITGYRRRGTRNLMVTALRVDSATEARTPVAIE